MANEKRLIDANVLIRDINADPYRTESEKSYYRCLVHRQPTVDAVEVVHGRWINKTQVIHGQVDYMFVCSACGNIYWESTTDHFNYCPNCGAKMDGDGNG